MKAIKNSIFAILALAAVSCTQDDVENRPVVTPVDGPVLVAPEEGNAYVLNVDSPEATVERFVWTPADFGQGVIVSYTVEIDSLGQDFDTPYELGSTNGTTNLAVSHQIMNNGVLEVGGEPDVVTALEVRVKAFVGGQTIYSDAVEISVTPYQGIIPLQNLYIVGDATEFGWNNNNNNNALFRDATNQFKFYYTGYFAVGGFKVLSSLGSWHPQYGTTGAGVLGVSNPDGSNEAGNIQVTTAGYYTFEMDIQQMTYSMTAFDATTSPSFASVGIIGAATPGGWDADTDMTATAANPHIWKGTLQVNVGPVKFRANDSWDLPGNWGGGNGLSGTVSVNGGDFQPVTEAGVYTVFFNDLDGRYVFIPQP